MVSKTSQIHVYFSLQGTLCIKFKMFIRLNKLIKYTNGNSFLSDDTFICKCMYKYLYIV